MLALLDNLNEHPSAKESPRRKQAINLVVCTLVDVAAETSEGRKTWYQVLE